MNIYSDGSIVYRVYYKYGTAWILLSRVDRSTGGTVFLINNIQWTDYGVFSGYTNYEEIWSLEADHDTPTYDFRFDDNLYGGSHFTGWSGLHFFQNAPSGIRINEVTLFDYYTTIDNPDG